MFAAPLRFFRPSVECNLRVHIEYLQSDANEILDGTDLKSANFDPDPIELTDNNTLHSYLGPLYRENSPLPRSPVSRLFAEYNQNGTKHVSLAGSLIGEVDFHSTLRALGLVKGFEALDLACGVGRWSKYLVQNGAKEVVGIDISEAMIGGAKELQACLPAEQADRLSFRVGDCSLSLGSIVEDDSFDLVLGTWYLSYAPDHHTLVTMFRNICTNLRPGGRFLGVVPNSFCTMFEPYDMYGVRMEVTEEVAPGHWKCEFQYLPDQNVFHPHYRMHGLYEMAAKEAGMGELRWKPYVLPEGDDREERGYWDEFKLRPYFTLLEDYKPA